MAAFSFQMTKPLPGIEGGMANYKQRQYYERGSTFGHYDLPPTFPADSEYHRYGSSGLGTKLRMHPMAAALVRVQLRGLDRRNAMITDQILRLNERITQLPGLFAQGNGRKDVQRIHYAWDILFIDEAKSGMSREKCVAALRAEGVNANAHYYPLQHKLPLYHEAQWWHHPPVIPDLPGSEKANVTGINLPCFTSEAPELVDQYIAAFEKVWAHRKELA